MPPWEPARRESRHPLPELEGSDSAVSCGFFNAIEQKEYGEAYLLEKITPDMLEKDPQLKEEFERRIAEERDFAASPEARLNFFHRRSPWWDSGMGLSRRVGSLLWGASPSDPSDRDSRRRRTRRCERR